MSTGNDSIGITRPQIKVGDVNGGNFAEFEADGTLRYRGDSTIWDDVVGSLYGRRLYSTTGTIKYNEDEIAIEMEDGGDITNKNDRLIFALQYPHRSKPTGIFALHIHWEQINNDKIEFTTEYRVQSNFKPKTTNWTRVIRNSDDDSVGVYDDSGNFNQITRLAEIDMAGAGISATVDFRVTRSDNLTPVILAKFIDAHYEIDSDGSHEEYIK